MSVNTAVSTVRANVRQVNNFENPTGFSAKPGTVVEVQTTGALLLPQGAIPNEVLVVVENSKHGDGIDTAITSGNGVDVLALPPGNVVWGRLTASGQGATAGIPMKVNVATGEFKDATAPALNGLNASGLSLTGNATMADVASGAGLVSGINQNLANLAAEVASLRSILEVKGVTTGAAVYNSAAAAYFAPIRIK